MRAPIGQSGRKEEGMKQVRRVMIGAIALVSVQCSDASAPESMEPIISPSGRIAFVT
jgi:hypothetical protein